MKKTETLNLIDGQFSYEDAQEILTKIFANKINYHNLKNWSSNERFGKDDEVAQERLPFLRKEIDRLNTIIALARNENKKVAVYAEIQLTILD